LGIGGEGIKRDAWKGVLVTARAQRQISPDNPCRLDISGGKDEVPTIAAKFKRDRTSHIRRGAQDQK
jgi:hypothetical protein